MKINGRFLNILSKEIFVFFILFLRTACGTAEKDFLTKNEFISFMLNEKDLVQILMKLKNLNITAHENN